MSSYDGLTSNSELEPYREIYRAVIEQALRDLVCPPNNSLNMDSGLVRESARRFLSGNDEGLHAMCSIAGISPHAVYRIRDRILSGEKPLQAYRHCNRKNRYDKQRIRMDVFEDIVPSRTIRYRILEKFKLVYIMHSRASGCCCDRERREALAKYLGIEHDDLWEECRD